MIDGIINVYKEQNYTSFDVVAKLRGILKQKKIGHTGTLDPMAEGVLLVCLGKATKLVDLLTEGNKCYRATMKLGYETDTEDVTGEKTVEGDSAVISCLTEETIRKAILSFVGKYDQIPPMYSAIKKDGKKLYEYARAGIEIEREARTVEIYDISNIVKEADDIYSFDVHCSKGTYIRSLCRDIGRKLSCMAVMSGLLRKDVHGFSVTDAMTLQEIEKRQTEGTLQQKILPVDALLQQYPAYEITEQAESYLKNGNKLSPRFFKNMGENREFRIRVYNADGFAALYDYKEEEQLYKPFKMFL